MTKREQPSDTHLGLLDEGNRNVRIAERRDYLESSCDEVTKFEHEEPSESIKVVRAQVGNLIVVGCNES